MSIPTHDITCETKTYRTTCPLCGDGVWFFSCTCGSKVFLDRLSYPWEPHLCYEYRLTRDLELLQLIDRMTPDEIYRTIIKYEKSSGESTDDRTMDIIENVIGKRKSKLTTEIVKPQNSNVLITGKVMEVNRPINIFKRLDYDASTPMSVKLLGKIGQEKWVYARIRTNPDRTNSCFEYELYMTDKYFLANPLRKDNVIAGIAEPLVHPKGSIWKLIKHDIY